MGAEKWVAKNEFWDCCASSFCVFKVWVWEKEFTLREREERQTERGTNARRSKMHTYYEPG